MATNNDVQTLLVPVVRGVGGSVDLNATLIEAEKVISTYRDDDQAATEAVVETTENILSNKKYEKLKNISASTLAKMALSVMGEMPTEKLCAETEVRVKAYLSAQADKFLHIGRGRNAGFWFRDRLDADELAKLQKEGTKA